MQSVHDLPHDSIVPPLNTQVFKLLFVVEVGLRELIIREFERLGPSEWKRRLPPDVLDSFRSASTYERNITWTSLVPHHPIYYLDFPDLRKIIDNAANWRDVFRAVFKRKDVVVTTLAEIEPIRNRLAHNRLLSHNDVDIVEAALAKLSSALGGAGLSQLAAEPTVDLALENTLRLLRQEVEESVCTCQRFEPLELVVWPDVRERWWLDEDYLQHPIDCIREYFSMLEAYLLLPRSRGTGHRIESWVRSSDLDRCADSALAQIDALTGEAKESD